MRSEKAESENKAGEVLTMRAPYNHRWGSYTCTCTCGEKRVFDTFDYECNGSEVHYFNCGKCGTHQWLNYETSTHYIYQKKERPLFDGMKKLPTPPTFDNRRDAWELKCLCGHVLFVAKYAENHRIIEHSCPWCNNRIGINFSTKEPIGFIHEPIKSISPSSEAFKKETKGMNYSRAIFLINEDVRLIQVAYDLDRDGNPTKVYDFKTFDRSIEPGDFVVVPTETRVGMTVCKVIETDVECDVESGIELKWILGTVSTHNADMLIQKERQAITKIKAAEKAKRRRELRETLLANMDEDAIKALPLHKESEGDTGNS